MLFDIEVRVVKSAAEKGNHIVAPGTPAGGFDVAVAFHGNLARLLYAEQVGFVIEGTEMMHAVEPTLIGIGMALNAVILPSSVCAQG
jgi:hypothetical protein